jgi:hypothetical protein
VSELECDQEWDLGSRWVLTMKSAEKGSAMVLYWGTLKVSLARAMG